MFIIFNLLKYESHYQLSYPVFLEVCVGKKFYKIWLNKLDRNKMRKGVSCKMDNNIYNPDYVKVLFDKMSSSYKRINYSVSFGFLIRWRTQLLNSFHSTNNTVEIIDLMSGLGETWRTIKHKFPNSNLSALDFSDEMIKSARQKGNTKFINKITFLQQDVLQNQLSSNHYDFVTCAFGLKTFNNEQLDILAKEVKRVLKYGGQFSFIEISKPQNKILKTLFGFYLGKVIPIIGKLLFGSHGEYTMLWRYTNNFENAKNATEIFARNGLTTKFVSYFYGCATGFYGQKLH